MEKEKKTPVRKPTRKKAPKDEQILFIQNAVRTQIQLRIREYLQREKITRSKLAEKINVDKSLISKWMKKGGHNMSINSLVELQLMGLNIFKFDFATLINNEKINFYDAQVRKDAEKVKLIEKRRLGNFTEKKAGDVDFVSDSA